MIREFRGCLFCGGDLSDPNHWKRCDGKQGTVEAVINMAAGPVVRSDAGARPLPPGWTLEAYRAALQGMAHAALKFDTPAGDAFQTLALEAIRQVAQHRDTFIVDDVWTVLPCDDDTKTTYGSQIGPLLRQAARSGWIRASGDAVRSGRGPTHGHHVTVWRSLIRQRNGTHG